MKLWIRIRWCINEKLFILQFDFYTTAREIFGSSKKRLLFSIYCIHSRNVANIARKCIMSCALHECACACTWISPNGKSQCLSSQLDKKWNETHIHTTKKETKGDCYCVHFRFIMQQNSSYRKYAKYLRLSSFCWRAREKRMKKGTRKASRAKKKKNESNSTL